MEAILNKLDYLGFDNYLSALTAFYKEPFKYDGLKCVSPWDLSELTGQELKILQINHSLLNN